MSRLPTLFISHGAPTHALDAGVAGSAWRRLGETLARPRAVLIASAHWETDTPALTGAAQPSTIHDFHGFPEALYRIRYPAPGAPALAQRASSLLADAGMTAVIDPDRGLDHGAWTPLLHMFPAADVPVVQLSVQPRRGAAHHLELGRALAPLADEDVLVIGSGHMTHNLRDWMQGQGRAQPAAYVLEFRDWVDASIRAGDLAALADYRRRAPHAARAHPTEEHFLPLFIALGAAGEGVRPQRVLDTIEGGVLAMDAYLFQPPM